MTTHPLTKIAQDIAAEFAGDKPKRHADYGGMQRELLADRLYVASLDAPESYEGGKPQTVADLPGSERIAWLRVADEAIAALIEEPRVK